VNYNVLTANVTSWTLANGTVDGQQTTIEFCQNATGAFTVAGTPATLRGFMTIPTHRQRINAMFRHFFGTWVKLRGLPRAQE